MDNWDILIWAELVKLTWAFFYLPDPSWACVSYLVWIHLNFKLYSAWFCVAELVIYLYCLILTVCCRKISKYDPAALQDHILIFSCSIHSNYFYTILTKLFFQIRQYCLLLMNGGHIFLPPAFRFWKVTKYLTSALSKIFYQLPKAPVRWQI